MENISPKEFLISIIVVLVALSIAIFINPFIKDKMLDDVRTYQKALQVENDASMFQYAKQTQVGNVFAFGEMSSVTPMSIPELVNPYSIIEKVTERYTQHQRYVCDSHDKDGNCTSGHYETYYTWDTYGRDTYISNEFDFLGVRFQNAQLDLKAKDVLKLSADTVSVSYMNLVHSNYIYKEDNWFDSEGDLRFYYKTLPIKFYASLFTRFDGATPTAKVYCFMTRSDVLNHKEQSIHNFDIVYYLVCLLVVGGVYYAWAYQYGDVE